MSRLDYMVFVPWQANDIAFETRAEADEFLFIESNKERKKRGLKELTPDMVRVSENLGCWTYYYGTKMFGAVTRKIGVSYNEKDQPKMKFRRPF